MTEKTILNPGEEYRIVPLNMLAFRDIPRCDLTGARSTVQLVTHFNSIYYTNDEMAEQAWFGIIKKIDHLLAPLRQPAPIVGTSEERARRAAATTASKRSLTEFCLTESSNLLSLQKYHLAVPAAIQALKFCKDCDGDRSLAVVEPYLQLAQAYLGLEQLDKAEEFLSQGRWIVLNTSECEDRIKSRMYMLMGRVNTALGKFEEAKPEFANAIFFMSKFQGAEAVSASMGYFRLGDVYMAQGLLESALAFFDKVVDIWYKYLSALHNPDNDDEDGPLGDKMVHMPPELENLTEEQLAEGRSQLDQILDTRKQLLGVGHIATGEIEYTIGLFEFFLLGNEGNAEVFMNSAYHTYVYCSMFFLSFLVLMSLSLSYPSITVCLPSLTPHDTSLTIIPPSINQSINQPSSTQLLLQCRYKSSLGEAHPSTRHVTSVLVLVRTQAARRGATINDAGGGDLFGSQSIEAV
jgi:tetratricopeptide (TPR) repeat protein